MESVNLQIVLILTIGFTLACVLGYFTQRIKMSPILGYLLAGYMIGPFFPGFVADLHLAEQLAEVGVMLMMFGVGMHFKWQDLVDVKNIAFPGAIGQTLIATLASALFVHYIWGSWQAGIIMGLSIGVASTVVLVRVLSDNNLLNSLQGHIAVGWLIVEDILTVVVLILLPIIVAILTGEKVSVTEIISSVAALIAKFILLAGLMFTLGRRIVSYILYKIAQTRSSELFTLAVLALTFLIATGSALIFGTSIALGAFLAGMVIGQTDVKHQASAYSSSMKDAFVVIFFLSVGMLFNPSAIWENFSLFIGILAIIILIKPMTAFVIVILMRYPIAMALSIAFALAQIGEFSFILAEEAGKYHIFPDPAYDVIVACAIISISINPLLFKLLDYWKPYLDGKTSMESDNPNFPETAKQKTRAIVIGFGDIGRNAVVILDELGYHTVVIEKEVEKIKEVKKQQYPAFFGDASFPHLLELTHVELASLLVITCSDLNTTLNIVKFARDIHPGIVIMAFAQNVMEEDLLKKMGVEAVCFDELVNNAFREKLTKLEEKKHDFLDSEHW